MLARFTLDLKKETQRRGLTQLGVNWRGRVKRFVPSLIERRVAFLGATSWLAMSKFFGGKDVSSSSEEDDARVNNVQANGKGPRQDGASTSAGGGGQHRHLTAQQQKWYADGRCLKCGSSKHYAADCKEHYKPKSKGQSNRKG